MEIHLYNTNSTYRKGEKKDLRK